MPYRRLQIVLLLIGVSMISACSHLEQITALFASKDRSDDQMSSIHANYVTMGAGLEESESITLLLQPYKQSLDSVMLRPLTVLKEPLEMQRNQNESSLANVLTDILRSQASAYKRSRVDIAILNRGGIRLPSVQDTVKVQTIFELMPFENTLTFLELGGEEVLKLADELAAVGGEAVSGLRFSIRNGRAKEVLIGTQPVDPEKGYLIVTNNYLVEGGGNMPSLWKASEAEFTDILLRDLFINAFDGNLAIVPVKDGRIRIINN